MEKIDVALIGHGYWGKILEKYLKDNYYFSLKKIYSTSEEETEIITNNMNCILDDNLIKAVFIATPSNTHFDFCKKFLESKKHVFCEKPLVKSKEELNILDSLCEKNSRVLETDYIYLASKSIIKLKELLPKIGAIRYIEGNIDQFGAFYKTDDVFSIIGCHLFAVIIDFFGNNFKIKIEKKDYKNDLCVIGQIKLEYSTFLCEINVSVLSAEKKREIKIYGNNGFLVFNPLALDTVVLYSEKNGDLIKKEIYSFDESNNLVYALENFYFVLMKKKCSNFEISKKVTELLTFISMKN